MSGDNITIRDERDADRAAVHAVNTAAFNRAAEAMLIDRLRDAASPIVSLVAEVEDDVVGHILFTPVTLNTDDDLWQALALGPMAVAPVHQRRGIGSQLVTAGLEVCRAASHTVVLVLGHPEFYPRFGFTPTAGYHIRCEWDVPDEVFMVAELERGAIGGRTGLVKYHPAFHDLT